mmetsp:Transcript_35963/g.101839  ORF Transcript_35963/g.101839 Transcript_35963/m.101839 type:complete len:436 (-) Transcript_35963:1011-2318(-)
MSGVVSAVGGGLGLGGRPEMGAYGGPSYRLGYSVGGGGHYAPSGADPYAPGMEPILNGQYGIYNNGLPVDLGAPGGGGFAPQQQQQQPLGLVGYHSYHSSEDGEVSDDLESVGAAAGASIGPSHSNLYVKNIPEEVSEQQLEAAFRSYGDIDSCRLVRNLKTGASRGYGFVRYFRRQDAMMAITALNGFTFGNSALEVKFADSDAGPKSPKQLHGATPSDNLYVRNLPPSFTDADLVGLFRPYGEVVETRLLNAGTNEHGVRGMGALVRMGTVDQATLAIDSINGRLAPGGTMALMVRYADSAEDKARRHQRQLRGPRYSPYPAAGSTPASSHNPTASESAPTATPSLSSTNSLPAGFTGFTSTGLPDTTVEASSGMQKVPSVHTRMDAGVCSWLSLLHPLDLLSTHPYTRRGISFLSLPPPPPYPSSCCLPSAV